MKPNIFLTPHSKSQNDLDLLLGESSNSPVAWGTLFSDNYDRASLGSNYTKVGSQTCTIVSNELSISGGAASATFAETLRYSGYGQSGLMAVTQTVVHTIGSIAAAPNIDLLGVGFEGTSDQSIDISYWGGVMCGTSATFRGKVRIYNRINTTANVVATSAAALTINVGDELTITSTVTFYSITVTATNNTAGGIVSVTFTPTLGVAPSSTNMLSNFGYFSLLTYKGSQNVRSWTATTTELKYAQDAFIGDSITEIFSASSTSNSYPELWAANTGRQIIKWARGNNCTSDIIRVLPEIVAFAPRRAFLMIGGNDIHFSVPTATWKANVDTIISTLEAAGITVVLLKATPRGNGTGTNNIVPVNDYYDTKTNLVINTYTPLATGITANPTYFIADLVHPNDTGMSLIYTTIDAAV